VRQFARKAITGIVTMAEAKLVLLRCGGEAVGFKQGRGIIGALAAVGEPLEKDHTYEVLAYRLPENCGSKRMIDEESIFRMDKATAPLTFNNVDPEKRRVIITPRGPDPILFGVRGETADIVKKAFDMVEPLEPVERWVVFRTNQGTDAHLKRVKTLGELKPHCPAIVRGTVCKNPRMIRGRHVIFSIKDDSASVDCAAYEPTGSLRKIAQRLAIGDRVEAYGGVRTASENCPITVNLEKIRVLSLTPLMTYRNPLCRRCGKRLKSMGRGQGFRCERCGSRYNDLKKTSVSIERETRKGLFVAATRSQRHLTKPLIRYGLEKRHQRLDVVDCWHFP
jgi:tRNA(Ile2)-agmatinylcytidine synthase